ncbi:MAG TPA: hypothetical protein VF166_08290 [Gemmatimonadaceae bacterium]
MHMQQTIAHIVACGRSRRGAARAGAALAVVALCAGCHILDVSNPNNVNADALDNPAAAEAEVNGVVALTTEALNMSNVYLESASDNIAWTGSLDGMHQINTGFVRNPYNEFSDDADFAVNPARWTANSTVNRLEQFQQQGVLTDPTQLARANLFDGLLYDHIANMYDDFVISSDERTAGPPVGPANMVTLYDSAVAATTRGLAVQGIASELKGQLYAIRARAQFDKSIWQLLNPSGTTPANGLVANAGAAADADSALTLLGAPYRFQLTMDAGELGFGNCSFSSCMNNRHEIAFSPSVATYNYKTNTVAVALMDPIDNVPDPVIASLVQEFASAKSRAPITVTSGRAMLLIMAEDSLASGNVAGFTTAINQLRALDNLTPYSGQIAADSLLKYERRVNLYLQGRRLNDMYRFGQTSPNWTPESDAMSCPGSLFPISKTERATNPNVTQQPACGQ